jgi:hypothetical protein
MNRRIINFIKENKRTAAIYTLGLVSGVGIVAASIVGAADSSVPYTFQDGQVISADTMNDLFGRLKMSNEGFSTLSELEGGWDCKTYDFSGSSKTAGMPNDQFATDSTTGLQAISQTWTFNSSGALTVDKVTLGGIEKNNTGGCGGASSFSYTANIVAPYLALTGSSGCTNGNGYVLAVKRTSPFKFIAPVGQTVVSCTKTNQPPSPPSGLTASVANGGVSLSWTDNGGSPATYSILKKSSGSYASVGTVNAGTVTFTDSSGVIGDMYRVKAVNSNGASLASPAALAK